MRLYLDGELVASTRVPRSGIAKSQANPFRIGSPDNPNKIALDEVRFSLAALRPLEFLRDDGGVAVADEFEFLVFFVEDFEEE